MEVSKYTFITVLLICLVIMTLFISFTNNYKIEEIGDEEYIDPFRKQVVTTVNLYFVDGDQLKKENREVQYNQHNSLEQSTIDALSAGPKNKKYSSIFEDEVMVLSVKNEGNICFVNLSENLFVDDFDKMPNKELYIWSIVNTMTELDGVDAVQILIDGEHVDYEINDSNLKNPLYQDTSLNYRKKESAKTTLVEFLNLIDSNRLDLAYEFLTIETKEKYSFDEFNDYVNNLNEETSGYVTELFITNNFAEYSVVSVKYRKSEINLEETVLSFYKEWKVYKEDDGYKVYLEYRI